MKDREYTVQELVDELRLRSSEKGASVVWHDEYPEMLEELDAEGVPPFEDFSALLLTIGSMIMRLDDSEREKSRRKREEERRKKEEYTRLYREAIGLGARKILEGKPAFESSGSAKKFNQKNWTQEGQGDRACLKLKKGCSAYDAIVDIVENAGAWTLDCAAYVQVVELYARARALGRTAFDAEAGAGGKSFALKEHDSTGLTHRKLFYRKWNATDWWLRTPETDKRDADGLKVTASPEALLKAVPVGSRVTFYNADDRAAGSDYRRENTVKLGEGIYAAHPFGVLTEDGIKRKLAEQTVLRYGDEIEKNLKALRESDDPDAATAREALAELDALEKTDHEALVCWIFQYRRWSDDLIYDDLAEYVEAFIRLTEVEIYSITPEDAGTLDMDAGKPGPLRIKG